MSGSKNVRAGNAFEFSVQPQKMDLYIKTTQKMIKLAVTIDLPLGYTLPCNINSKDVYCLVLYSCRN